MTLARPVRPPPRLLPSLPLTHLRRAPAPPRPAPLLLLITWRRVPLRPPQAMLPLPPELAPATGVQAPTYQRGPVPQLLPLHPPPRTSTLRSPGRRAPAACAAGTPRSAARDARGAALRAPSCAPPAPAPVAATPDRARGSQEWAGRISRRSGSPSAGGNVRDASKTWNAIKIKNGDKNPTYQRAGGEHLEVPRGPVVAQHPGVDGAPCPCERVPPFEGVGSIRDFSSAMGSATSVISKKQSGLSIRGTIRRWWRKVRTVAAVTPRAARLLSAARSESSRLR
jgi:hypothetical protein